MTAEPLTPAQRAMRSSIAGLTYWANVTDRSAAAKPGADGLLARFEREVDPDGQLDPQTRMQRALTARKAHMRRLALKSSKARKAKKNNTTR